MEDSKKQGQLYLVPTPLTPGSTASIPEYNRHIVANCRHFITETLKLGRRHVKAIAPEKNLNACTWDEWNKKTDPELLEDLISPALAGDDICLLSDAGSPTIADPGAPVVALAHRKGIKVVPLSGPSAILLALMGSGFHGQHFTFHGYLAPQKTKLKQEIRSLARQAKNGITQVFMETPYRNQQLLQVLLNTLDDDASLCIACELTSPSEYILTKKMSDWKRCPPPDLHKRPCIFLVG